MTTIETDDKAVEEHNWIKVPPQNIEGGGGWSIMTADHSEWIADFGFEKDVDFVLRAITRLEGALDAKDEALRRGVDWMNRAEKAEQALAALREAAKVAAENIVSREARRAEILDVLEDKIGTAYECERCHHSTYHGNYFECEECGAEFPAANLIAFKLHAALCEDDAYIRGARGRLATVLASLGIDEET